MDYTSDRARVEQHVARMMNTVQTAEERTQRAYAIAQMYAKVEDYDKALSYVDMYLTTHHNEAGAFYFRGVILEKQGRLQDAVAAFTNSLSLKPKQKEIILKICEVVCCLDKPSEVQLSKWFEQAKLVGAPLRLLQSLEEKLAQCRQDVHTLDRLYQEQHKKAPDNLHVIEKMVNLKLSLGDLKAAKLLVDHINSRISQASDNLTWIQLSYGVYYRAYVSCQAEGMLAEQVSLLFGMLTFLSSIFFIKLSISDDKEVRDDLRRFDSHLSALHSALEKFPSSPQRQPYQLRFIEKFALFYQMAAFLLFKLAYDQILNLDEMLQLAAVCLSISFSITPPTTHEDSPDGLLRVTKANCRMCIVGYLLAALTRLNGQDWLKRIVKPKISSEGLSRIIEVLQLQVTRQTPSCIRLLMIDITQVSCAPPSRSHLSRYHEAYIRDNLSQLPSLMWLCLAEISAYGGFPSLPQLFAYSEQRCKSFPDGSEDLSRSDFSSCSRMDIEAFLYLSLYETRQFDTTVGDSNIVLLPIVLHKLKVLESRCNFWNSLHILDRASSNPLLMIKEASKHKTTVEKGLVSIRCLKKMELSTPIIFNMAKAFEHRLSNCSIGSPGYSEDRQTMLLARSELYWNEALRRVQLNEAGVSSLRDDSIPEHLATKLLSLQGKQAGEGLSEEDRNKIKSQAEMALADIALHRNHILKAITLYEKVDLPSAGFNHAQLLKHIALLGNPHILSGAHAPPPTTYDLLVRAQSILAEWSCRNEVKQDTQLLQRFQTELENLDKSIQDHKPIEPKTDYINNRFPEDESFKELSNNYHSNSFNQAYEQASAPPFPFPPQSAGPIISTSSPKKMANGTTSGLVESTMSKDDQILQLQLKYERTLLCLKQRDDVISDLSKMNVELRGIVQNLQYYFTDQKVLFKNPKDPENAILRPEDLDNLPTPDVPSTVHNLSGRNLSISNNSPQYPFNNSSSSNKTPINTSHRSLIDSYHPGMNQDSHVSPRSLANQSNRDFDFGYDDSPQSARQMLSLKTKPQPQIVEPANPFANLQLVGGSNPKPGAPNTSAPFRLNFQTPGTRGSDTDSKQSPIKQASSPARGEKNTNRSTDEFVCTAEHEALVDLPLIKTETGEENEDILFCKRGKLFRFRDGKWAEKGTGDMKVLKKHHEHKFRLLMRRDVVMKVCCNHLILTTLDLKPQSQSERSVTWTTHADFSEEGPPESITLAIRFKTSEIRDEFIKVVDKCKQTLKNSLLPRSSPNSVTQSVKSTASSTPKQHVTTTGPQTASRPVCMEFGPQLEIPQTIDRPQKNYSDSDSDSDTEYLSNSDNEATDVLKGPLKIASSSEEQILFQEKASIIVSQSGEIKDLKRMQVRVTGDPDIAKYRLLIHEQDNSDMLCDHEIRSNIDLKPYATQKGDKSWCLAVNQINDPSKKSRFILRFTSSAVSAKFNGVIQECINEIKSTTKSNSLANISEKEILFSNNEFGTQSNTSTIFGMEALPGFTFGSSFHDSIPLVTSSGSNFGSFVTPSIPAVPTATSKDKEEINTSQGNNSYEADPYFEPVVVLPTLTELKTGEEGEVVLFFQRARLFRLINKEWKERGVGELKILHTPNTGKHRIIMRRDVVKKLCCNHYITSEMAVKKNQKNEKICNWFTTADYSEETPQPQQLAARFKTVEIAAEFIEMFQKCLTEIKTAPSPKLHSPYTESKPKPPVIDPKSEPSKELDDVIIISVSQPTEDQVRKARELMLPDYFYLYENKPACPGCRGCEEEDDPIQHSTAVEAEVIKPIFNQARVEPRADIPYQAGSIFRGNLNLNLSSFSSIVSTESSSFKTSSGNPFAKCAKPLFNQDKQADTDSAPYEPDAHYKPLVQLPELEERKTGEEDDKVLYTNRCILFRYVDKEWKERGRGEIKILHNPDTNKYRVLMRRDIVKKICCNHNITNEMKLKYLMNNDKTLLWQTYADYSEGSPQSEQLSARFKKPAIANEFKEIFENCQEEIMNQTLIPSQTLAPTQQPDSADVSPVEDVIESKQESHTESTTNGLTCSTDSKSASDKIETVESESEQDDDVIFIPPKEPTPEQIALIEEFKLPRYFYSYEDKPDCKGCRGCESNYEIVYEKDRPDQCRATDDVVQALRDASEDISLPKIGAAETSIFGPQPDGLVSFTDVAQSTSVQGFTGQGNHFKSFARPLFVHTSKEGEESGQYEPDAHFKPIVDLPEIQDIKTGEEGENIIFKGRTTLYRFTDSQWKEKGKGEMKILHNKETDKYRLLMRRDKVKKICCNHFIAQGMVLNPLQKSESSWVWYTNADFSEETHRPETLTVRFSKAEVGKEFKEVFDRCVAILNQRRNDSLSI
ncbi:E3 SUMO-protein ligase RanBP2 [Oopsacas minuta]|uniref:E3 SUMO-protein ligase RanBP2 n=1 Tax=Oopsacas minuta TaxID=111878 RepID=A0AAV7K262_9METZ|nr:E3 SUMO-protein ligase RanBP2 [Oopsacas minuta]